MPRTPRYVQLRLPKDPDLIGVNRILAGIMVIAAYDAHAELAVAHDQLFFGKHETVKRMSQEDRALLEAWGWTESQESWSHLV